MNFDQILSAIGGFGKYQKTLYVWICLPQILLAFHMMASIFTGATPAHHCRSSHRSLAANQSWFPDSLQPNFSLSDSSCSSADGLLQQLRGNRTERVPCVHGWVYSREIFQSTTVTEVHFKYIFYKEHLSYTRGLIYDSCRDVVEDSTLLHAV